jgi:hypothetical protein
MRPEWVNKLPNSMTDIWWWWHVSGDCVPIIRRNNCIYATLGICHSVWMSVWFAGFSTLEKRNKHTKKNSAPSWLYLEDGNGKCSAKCWTRPDRFIFEMWLWCDDTVVSTRVLFESTCVSPLLRQDIATDHNSTPCLLNFFGDRVIIIITGLWLPYSPVLDQCYVCLWSMLRTKVYSVNPLTWDDLKESIQYILFTVSPAELYLAVKMFLTFNLHVRVKGNHFSTFCTYWKSKPSLNCNMLI